MSSTKDFSFSKDELKKYKGPGGHVVIPEGTTRIGNGAFQDCETVTGVVIPEGVEIIGNDAFRNCINLESVVIPDSVKWIFMRAFQGCKKLCDQDGFFVSRGILLAYSGPGGDIVIPEGVTGIGSSVFENRADLTSVVIPEGVTVIGACAFSGCSSLSQVTISDSVTTIEAWAFQNCKKLTSIVFGCGLTAMEKEALTHCGSLKKVTLPVSAGPVVSRHLGYKDDLRIHIPDLSALSPVLRPCAALCFAEDGGLAEDSRFDSHGKYLHTNCGKLLEQAAGNTALLALLCREGWIKAKDIQKLVDTVQKTGDPERIAMILDYQGNKLTGRQKEKAAKNKEAQENTVLDRAVTRVNREGIEGLNFAVTGEILTFANRKELKAFIESCGGKLQSSVSARTDYLIFNDTNLFSWNTQDTNSEKIQKAKELGIEIITELQLYEKAGKEYVRPAHSDWF